MPVAPFGSIIDVWKFLEVDLPVARDSLGDLVERFGTDVCGVMLRGRF